MKFVKEMTSGKEGHENFGVAEGFLIVPGQGLKCVVSGLENMIQRVHEFLKSSEQKDG
jgi:hypothetical protein